MADDTPAPRGISWLRLEQKAERVCAWLALAGVDAPLVERVRAELLAVVARVRPYVRHRAPPGRRVMREKMLDTIEERLNRVEAWLTSVSLEDWGRLLHEVLPERYDAPPAPARPAGEREAPGMPGKTVLMRERVEAGEGLHHPEDPSELPDRLALLLPPAPGNGALRPVLAGGRRTPGRLIELQGEGREDLETTYDTNRCGTDEERGRRATRHVVPGGGGGGG